MTGTFHQLVRSFKRELVRSALRAQDGNRLQAARELGISRCYLHRLLTQLNITDDMVDHAELDNAEIEDEEPQPALAPARTNGRGLSTAIRVA
jgi:hypothetical protein